MHNEEQRTACQIRKDKIEKTIRALEDREREHENL